MPRKVHDLGAVLFHAVTGRRTFPGETGAQVTRAVVELDPPGRKPRRDRWEALAPTEFMTAIRERVTLEGSNWTFSVNRLGNLLFGGEGLPSRRGSQRGRKHLQRCAPEINSPFRTVTGARFLPATSARWRLVCS